MYTFHKSERLCNKRAIADLYASPHRMMAFPFSVYWTLNDNRQGREPLQVIVVAPKKKLHHAVDRNRAKRLMRECYRLRKHRLTEALKRENRSMTVGINYIHNEIITYQRMGKLFDKIFDQLESAIATSKADNET